MDEFQVACKAAAEMHQHKPRWLNSPYIPPPDLNGITQRAIDVYLLSQKPNGEMGGIGWWQSANGYTAIALRDLWSGDRHNYRGLGHVFTQLEHHHSDMINKFNDDTLWWAMCCMVMYHIDGSLWYLDVAKQIWHHVRKYVCKKGQVMFRGQDMEGGCYWTTNVEEEQLNSISTGLFAELSVRLAITMQREPAEPGKKHQLGKLFNHKETSVRDYIDAAKTSLNWILRFRYRPEQAIVLDHIKLKSDKLVDWTFTYNTGVALGVSALLYDITREETYMTLACHMAHKSMRRPAWVEDNGVLTEKGAYGKGTHDPAKNNDAVGFKAILVRQLAVLYGVIHRTQCQMEQAKEEANIIRVFVNLNLQSQLERNSNRIGQYGPWWNGPFETPTSHSQMAALDVLSAAVLVNRH